MLPFTKQLLDEAQAQGKTYDWVIIMTGTNDLLR